MIVEIPSRRWRAFCEKLNSHFGALVDVRAQMGGDMQPIAQAALLHFFKLETTADCRNILTIEFSLADQGPTQHRIEEPIRLLLRTDTDDDHYNVLEIPAENGITVVIFHPGISLMMLDDLRIPQTMDLT